MRAFGVRVSILGWPWSPLSPAMVRAMADDLSYLDARLEQFPDGICADLIVRGDDERGVRRYARQRVERTLSALGVGGVEVEVRNVTPRVPDLSLDFVAALMETTVSDLASDIDLAKLRAH